jgi:hypothetical protein
MAGSYNHCVAKDGQLLVNRDLVQMIENLGDAYEAIEEMYGMIWRLASSISDKLLIQKAIIEAARCGYQLGIDASPGQEGRLDPE